MNIEEISGSTSVLPHHLSMRFFKYLTKSGFTNITIFGVVRFSSCVISIIIACVCLHFYLYLHKTVQQIL